ncbi:recombinase family protein [Belliella sp. DSM 111904]|uniref:Recombinase family protein n=1 Tax=Belliella filtrata TaxID=2923435 RepID=A0ABS9UX32_9BACT|nr:recombinase family protein [Belliella filtrata]MCH7408711.1 recombinase family protein [Belliella filtrata]
MSTDEQADKGYSLQHQEESLRKYCLHNDIEVRKVVQEDYSAKTFRRPAWTEMLDDIKKRKMRAKLVLFTKWDRFSRNAGDAYQMISILRKLGVAPQGIEQPLDLSVPENKMMLAFYLAAPEVENDRRALNVFHGMRRARKDGRWLWKAPYGYRNRTTPEGRPTIVVHEEEAAHLKWIYTTIAEGNYSCEQIIKKARENGSKLTKNNFWWLIRNPFYYGKTFVPPYKDEQGVFVKGQHQPIITETLFNEAQLVLDGNKRNRKTQIVTSEQIPLRGFLDCPKCSRSLTASASKGRKQNYHYYHCTSKCGVRFKADEVNDSFVKHLANFKLKPEFIGVIKTIFSQLFDKEKNSEIKVKHKLLIL